MDATVALHRAVLDRTNHCRPGLSPDQEKLAMVALLRYVLAALSQPVMSWLVEPACSHALHTAVIKFSDPQPADGSPLDSLLTLTSAALMVLRRHGDKEEELQDLVVQLSVLLGDKSAKDCSRIDRRAPLRRLEAWLAKEQQRTVLPLALPLAELKLAGCHLLHRGALQLLKQRIIGAEARGQQGGRLPDHIALEAAMSATQSLLHMAPKEGRPNALMCIAELFMVGQQPDEAAKAYRMALGRAAEVKAASSAGSLTDHVVEAGAASLLVTVLMYRRVEERWSLAEVSGVLHQADTALASCRRWLPNATLSDLRRDLASARRAVKATAEQHPGQDRLPRPTFVDDGEPCVLDRTCAGCNRSSVHLQACAACRAVYYCRHVRMVS
ncbi:hypothetical protein COHA_009575 [Chlorella ohadii]|uniref:Uncharacterized protein n=1 Tax=Chlorella ohadii TaxID=2649997 RepID=A0AAD5DHK5_9CHLO|nr:hypothetical protein COHA_009575 [Chlorella ohadii]